MTKTVVFGAGGRAGRAVLREAERRGLATTAVVRDPARHPDLRAQQGDVGDAGSVAAVARGHDTAIVTVYSAESHDYAAAMRSLLEGLERAGTGRLLVVGLATTLGALPEGFPEAWRPFVDARHAELAVLRDYDGPVDWVVLTPPMGLVASDDGGYTYAALAAALLDEVAAGRHHRRQIALNG